MCGIAGFVDPSSKYNGSDVLRTMAHQLAHRGPDDTGIWLNGDLGIGLSHTRLSIVDLSSGGHQPKESSTGRFIIMTGHEAARRGNIVSLAGRLIIKTGDDAARRGNTISLAGD